MEKRYASRGGEKLEHALKEFKIEVRDKICLDVGASTGGFTDCLLEHGAAKVYALDVGYGQLAWKLQKDARVERIDRTNVRYLKPKDPRLGTYDIGLCTIDVSFISLSKVLPAVYNQLEAGGEVLALIKPQFEARREQVPRGGVVTDEKVREEVIARVRAEAEKIGFKVLGLTPSPITGADGNVEYFIYLVK